VGCGVVRESELSFCFCSPAAEAGGEERVVEVTVVLSLAGGVRMDSSGWAL
jgi:hypothetical protein